MTKTVLVCEAQVPFVSGGAELLVRNLVDQLRRRGYRADRVALPFKWYPKEELLAQTAAGLVIDVSESNGERIDAVIATKFPTYFVRHPRKVSWLLHQYRAIYDLCGTPYSEFTHAEADVRLRDRLIALDNQMLRESPSSPRRRCLCCTDAAPPARPPRARARPSRRSIHRRRR